jgi:hypothetical protein
MRRLKLGRLINNLDWKNEMSGGSYNYLANVFDLKDLLGKIEELEQMANRLEGLSEVEFPGAVAAGHMTRDLLLMIKLWESHATVSVELLSGVWHDVEWWDSNDYGPDQVREGLRKLLHRPPNQE